MAVDSGQAEPLGVDEALFQMQQLIRSGEIMKAKEVGERCVVPLSLHTAELGLAGKMSEGAESTVFLGRWRCQPVAIKRCRIATSADLERFRRELSILATLKHPAVVPVLGARCLPPDYQMVLPLAAGGNVRQLLHEQGWRPGWKQLLSLALQVASGMQHVHDRGFLHCDIKPANLLALDSAASTVQIADFGLAVRYSGAGAGEQEKEEEEGGGAGNSSSSSCHSRGHTADSVRAAGRPTGGFHKRQMVGTLEYMAPELLMRTAAHSRASDVYAFAVTVNEMATGTIPFSDCTKDNPEVHTVLEMGYGRQELAAAVAAEGLRPMLPRRCPPGLAALLGRCWDADPGRRPSFAAVRAELEALLEQCGEDLPSDGTAVVVRAEAEPMDLDKHSGGQDGDSGAAQQQMVPGSSCAHQGSSGLSMHPFTVLHPSDTELRRWQACSGSAATAAAGAANGQPESLPRWLGCLLGGEAAQQNAVHSGVNGAGGSQHWPIFNAGSFEAIGPRDSQEDRTVLLPHPLLPGLATSHHHQDPDSTSASPPTGPLLAAAAVFDGHRGSEAAEFCARRLPGLLAQTISTEQHAADEAGPASGAAAASAALRSVFLTLEAEYHEHWQQQRRAHAHLARGASAYPGCAALVALLAGRTLLLANAGDCRGVLCRARRGLAGSRDHTALLPDERERLAAAGAAVAWQHGSWRVGASGLQVTRCIGDFDVKQQQQQQQQQVHKQQACSTDADASPSSDSHIHSISPAPGVPALTGVTALPEVTAVELGPDDHFLILASDGLWDVMSVQEAVGLVYDTVKDPTLAGKRLVCEALMRGSADNVTAVVVFLTDSYGTLERVYGAAEGELYAATSTAYGSRVRLEKDRHVCSAVADEMRDTY